MSDEGYGYASIGSPHQWIMKDGKPVKWEDAIARLNEHEALRQQVAEITRRAEYVSRELLEVDPPGERIAGANARLYASRFLGVGPYAKTSE